MKNFGQIMLWVGFLAASYFTVVETETVPWMRFLPPFIVSIVGVVLMRVGNRKEKSNSAKVSSDMETIKTSISNLVTNAEWMEREKTTIGVYDIAPELDKRFRDDLNNFAEARESITFAHSLQAYADVMSHFAAGERYLNRVWSCSVDGYIDECHTYVTKFRDQFVEAKNLLDGLSGHGSNGGLKAANG